MPIITTPIAQMVEQSTPHLHCGLCSKTMERDDAALLDEHVRTEHAKYREAVLRASEDRRRQREDARVTCLLCGLKSKPGSSHSCTRRPNSSDNPASLEAVDRRRRVAEFASDLSAHSGGR